MTFDAVADELYSLPPGDFVASRNARAKEMTGAGDKSDAAEVRKLARPSPSAWLVNCLVRQDRKDIDRLFSLRSAFHDAQKAAARNRLRELSAERQSLIDTLVARARAIATRTGQAMTPAVQGELERTLEAAVADEDAARAVRQGRLVRGLSHVGFGGLDLTPPPGAAKAQARRMPDVAERVGTSTSEARRPEQERTKRRGALQRAEATLKETRRRHRAAESDWRKAADELARAERGLSRATEALARATAEYEQAKGERE